MIRNKFKMQEVIKYNLQLHLFFFCPDPDKELNQGKTK